MVHKVKFKQIFHNHLLHDIIMRDGSKWLSRDKNKRQPLRKLINNAAL